MSFAVDRFLQDEERKSLPLNEHLTKLLNIMDIAQSLKLGMTRAKRVKIIKYVKITHLENYLYKILCFRIEIALVRRRIAIEQSGTPSRRGRKSSKTQSAKQSKRLNLQL